MAKILLVHGAWHGAWCWTAFAARLAGQGHDTALVELRGHDHAPGRIWHRLSGYVEDLDRAVAGQSGPVVLVGHSMGGFAVQHYLAGRGAGRDVAGAVLIASVPPRGALAAVLRFGGHHPAVLAKATALLSLKPLAGTEELARELFFTPDTPQQTVEETFLNLQDESYPAFVDMIVRPVRPGRVSAPVLVLGGEGDGVISVDEVHRTATAYGTTAEIFAGTGHDMMLDRDWPAVADRIDRWVTDTVRG